MLILPRRLGAYAILLRPQLGRELGAKIIRLEYLTDLDLGFSPGERIRAAHHHSIASSFDFT
jgi:hypothetical protein